VSPVDIARRALCQPVIVEMLSGVDAKSFDRANDRLRTAYPWVPVPDDVWSIVEATSERAVVTAL
jgi:hypothetical protein